MAAAISDLEPGTRCVLTNLVKQTHLQGREVQVIGPHEPPAGETGAWFALRAPWISEEFPGQDFVTRADCLRPLER